MRMRMRMCIGSVNGSREVVDSIAFEHGGRCDPGRSQNLPHVDRQHAAIWLRDTVGADRLRTWRASAIFTNRVQILKRNAAVNADSDFVAWIGRFVLVLVVTCRGSASVTRAVVREANIEHHNGATTAATAIAKLDNGIRREPKMRLAVVGTADNDGWFGRDLNQSGTSSSGHGVALGATTNCDCNSLLGTLDASITSKPK